MVKKRKTKTKKKSSSRRKTKRKGVQIGSPQVFELYGGL